MKNTFYLLLSFILINQVAIAQIDQVSVGASYSQQAYYSLATGDFVAVDNDAWDIAFSNEGDLDGGIFINESSTFMQSSLLLFSGLTTDWNEVLDPNVYADSLAIYNTEESWVDGAFNTLADPDSPFDYGWGEYNMSTHVIEGNQVYVIKLRDESYIKFMVDDLTSGVYNFRYANLDGSNEIVNSIAKTDYPEKDLIHFSFETNEYVDVPSDYDLLFQRYVSPLDDGNGGFIEYTVTGVLTAPGIEAVVAEDIDIEEVNHEDYANDYSSLPSTIGHDWKYFDFTVGWVVDLERAQFVKTRTGEIYKVIFFDFEGSSTGITTLEKSLVGNTSTNFEAINIDVQVFPNPFTDYVILSSDKSLEGFQAKVYNQIGQLILNTEINSEHKVTIPNNILANIYYLEVYNEENRVFVSKIVKE